MVEDQRLQTAIEEGVAKGVPVDFITYSLNRAGWPQEMVQLIQALQQYKFQQMLILTH